MPSLFIPVAAMGKCKQINNSNSPYVTIQDAATLLPSHKVLQNLPPEASNKGWVIAKVWSEWWRRPKRLGMFSVAWKHSGNLDDMVTDASHLQLCCPLSMPQWHLIGFLPS